MLPCKRPARSGLRRWQHGAGRLSSGADLSGQGRRGSSVGRRGSPPPWRIRSPRPPSLPSPVDPVNSGGESGTGATDPASGERAGLLRIRRQSPRRRAESTPTPLERCHPSPLSLCRQPVDLGLARPVELVVLLGPARHENRPIVLCLGRRPGPWPCEARSGRHGPGGPARWRSMFVSTTPTSTSVN